LYFRPTFGPYYSQLPIVIFNTPFLFKLLDVSIHGPTMAWILTHAMVTDKDSTYGILGEIRIVSTPDAITDSQGDPGRRTKEKYHIHVKVRSVMISVDERRDINELILTLQSFFPMPIKVWNPFSKEWNHLQFKEWENEVKEKLGLVNNEQTKVLGLLRFRRGNVVMVIKKTSGEAWECGPSEAICST
jgi:hypothetical protein